MEINLSERNPVLAQFTARLGDLAKNARVELVRGLNAGGDVVRTAVVRDLAEQSGAKYGAVRKTLATVRASESRLSYGLEGTGEFIPLMDFGAKKSSKGVTAAPWGRAQFFQGAFIVKMKSGHEGVFSRVPGLKKIKELWGPAIPREMTRGDTLQHFEESAATVVMPRIMTRINKLIASGA